jgi:hypothetical protein
MTKRMVLAGLLALASAPALAGDISPADRKAFTQALVNPRHAAERNTEPAKAEATKAVERPVPIACTCQHA